jgi:hypothetical protein
MPKNVNGCHYLEDLVADGKIILNAILRKDGLSARARFSWFHIGPFAGSCEHGNEYSRYIKGGIS